MPEREKIASFASHGATMVIFLSTGLLKELSRELIRGGYQETTPAAIVYKATWPEEKAVVCQVGTLYETALREHITKTALILVGEAVAHRDMSVPGFTIRALPQNFEKGRMWNLRPAQPKQRPQGQKRQNQKQAAKRQRERREYR